MDSHTNERTPDPSAPARKPRRRSQTRDAALALRKALRAAPASIPLRDILDRRTVLGMHFADLHDGLVAALGGRDAISPQRFLLLEQVVKTKILIDAYDAALFGGGLDPKDADARKLAADASKLRYLLSQLLAQAGLDRVAAPVESPLEILRRAMDEGDGEVTP